MPPLANVDMQMMWRICVDCDNVTTFAVNKGTNKINIYIALTLMLFFFVFLITTSQYLHVLFRTEKERCLVSKKKKKTS